MARKKLLFVFGTRPEAIKLAPVISAAKRHGEVFETVVATTGQHREMLDQVLKVFNIKPDHDLKIMKEGQTVTNVVVRSLEGLNKLLSKVKPDMMIVQGDTSTTFAAGLAAFYNKIGLAHVEAGLRTWDKHRPYPEEMNRKLTSSLADIHFAPTVKSKENLVAEGVPLSSIYLTGNTVVDALLEVAKAKCDLNKYGVDVSDGKKLVLLTTHRRENFGAPLQSILTAAKQIASKYSSDIKMVVPVHKNPSVQTAVKEELKDLSNVKLVDPLDYVPFVHLMKASYLILTDSGGVQEEAPSFGKPVFVLREVTERPEGIMAGTVKLVGIRSDDIVAETSRLMESKNAYEAMSRARNPYGDGRASERIIKALLHRFGFEKKRPAEFEVKVNA